MPRYDTLEDLPKELKRNLPKEARELYLAVHRRTWEECRMDGNSSETKLADTAHDAAMLAVQEKFEKNQAGRWKNEPIGEEVDADKIDRQKNRESSGGTKQV